MDKDVFLKKENWYGGYYELTLEYYPTGNTHRLIKGIESLYNVFELNGLWDEVDSFPDKTGHLPQNIEENGSYHLLTTLTLPNCIDVGAKIVISRIERESDWITLCIPMGMLELAYPVRYDLEYVTNKWLTELDNTLIQIAKKVYEECPFNLAMIGWEISGYTNQEEITKDLLTNTKLPVILPIELNQKLNPKCKWTEITEGLLLFQHK